MLTIDTGVAVTDFNTPGRYETRKAGGDATLSKLPLLESPDKDTIPSINESDLLRINNTFTSIEPKEYD